MKQSIKETSKELQSELGKISIRHNEVMEKQRKVYLQYHGLISVSEELMSIDEVEKARSLDSKIKSLRSQVDKFEKEISALSPERIKKVVSKHPDSQLHKMALSIQTKGLKEIEALQKEIDRINTDVEKAKETYLKAVESTGNCYRSLFDIYLMVRKAEEMLSEKKAKKPSKIPSMNSFFPLTNTLTKGMLYT